GRTADTNQWIHSVLAIKRKRLSLKNWIFTATSCLVQLDVTGSIFTICRRAIPYTDAAVKRENRRSVAVCAVSSCEKEADWWLFRWDEAAIRIGTSIIT